MIASYFNIMENVVVDIDIIVVVVVFIAQSMLSHTQSALSMEQALNQTDEQRCFNISHATLT